MKPKSGRTIGLFTKVSPEEKALIDKKMKLLGIKNLRAYLRKMAVDGYIVRLDMSDVKAVAALLKICANNMNQIARRANETRNLYAEDVEDLQRNYSQIWDAMSTLLKKFEDIKSK